MPAPSPESILHLAALATGLSIAYVGLDKIHPADRKLDAEIDFAAKNWALLVQELELNSDLTDGDRHLNEIYNINAMHLLCFVARKSDKSINVRCRERWRPAILFVLRQYHFPLLPYFRRKIDLAAITGFALASTIFLILLSAEKIYEIEFSGGFVKFLFWYFTINIFFIFITAFCSSKLFSIRRTCAIFEEQVRTRVKRFSISSVDRVTKVLADAAKRIG